MAVSAQQRCLGGDLSMLPSYEDAGTVYRDSAGKQVKKAGFALMLDFHYSDTWADPAKQFMPKRWKDASPETLPDRLPALYELKW